MMRARRELLQLVASSLVLIGGISVSPLADAAYTMTVSQVGANVVVTGSGSINLTALTSSGTASSGAVIWASNPTGGEVQIGSAGNTDMYSGYTGSASFGSGSATPSTSDSGPFVGIRANNFLQVPQGYSSGALLAPSTSTWNSTTIAALGLTPGTYTWTWGSGASADSFTLVIGAVPSTSVPTLNQWGLIVLSSLLAMTALVTMRRKQQ